MEIDYNSCKKIVLKVINERNPTKINENTIWHKHHILPKCFGGKNEEENIVKVSVEEHAIIHRMLFEEFKQKQDWLAWQGLSGFLGKEEIIKESIRIGSRKAGKISGEKALKSGLLFKISKKGIEKFREKFLNEEDYRNHFSKISKLQTGISKPELKNYIWITNGSENKKIHISESLPLGFKRGRTKKWKTGFNKEKKEKVCCPYCKKIGGIPVMKRFHFENCRLKEHK